ncbi:uncharacterized protein LOC125195066 [Salvia hispanica]|uniref:uncharacterized protein LOC125195066 n=1 Tax=Salvia hispanica TaxID=49212 RepID=UPI0020090ACC|nr:uncharacterized protein LOC125195066 [Salvia hispanica]
MAKRRFLIARSRLVFGKMCHLPVGIKHKAYWAKERSYGMIRMPGKLKVLLFQSRLKLMPGKLKSKWVGPYTIVGIRANGEVEIQGSASNSVPFLVNGHRVKVYRDNSELCVVDEVPLHALPTTS